MANVLQELSNICRFCLCHNVKLLLPIVKTLQTLLTIEDIERFTGIQLDPADLSYTVCLECINKMKIAADFRSLCISNDTRFQMLHSMLLEGTECASNEPIVCIETFDDYNGNDTIDYASFGQGLAAYSCDEPVSSRTLNRESFHAAKRKRSTASEGNTYNVDEDSYSANFIEPGVTLVTDEEDSDPENYFNTKLNPSYPVVGAAKCNRGKRKAHLCDACGKMAVDLPYHYLTHAAEPKFACPHCPVMIKQKNSLHAHIKTVHLKMITKTCEICGKGFIHHKTYRYHMRSHQSQGDTFECKTCSKKFSHPSGLEQHFKRFHSIVNNQK